MKIKILTVFFLSASLFLTPQCIAREKQPQLRLFVSMIQDPPVLSDRAEIDKLVNFARETGVKVIFIQVYRGNRSWFPSRVADDSLYRISAVKMSADPLALLIRKAHEQKIQVHAWLNLLSLSSNENAPLLKKYGTRILTRNIKNKQELEDYRIDGQFFLEPGDTEVRKELSSLVSELLTAYPGLDGIQFDYIRYPDVHPFYGYTRANVERFKDATGKQAIVENSAVWKSWKRRQVTELLEILVKRTRQIRPRIIVSATGCASFTRAYEEAFQDWPSWIKSGLVDFVTLMAYTRDPRKFARDIHEAEERTAAPDKLHIAVGAYKLADSPETFQDQLQFCEKQDCGACAIFHYGSLEQNPRLAKILNKEEK